MNFNTNELNYLSRSCFSLFVFLNILVCNNLNAGEITLSDSTKKQSGLSILSFYQQGIVIPTNDFVRGNNIQQSPISSFRAISMQLSRQTTGEELWEQLYNFPRYGVGIHSAQFMPVSEPGRPISIFGIFSTPRFRWNKISLNTDIGFGITFNWRPFNENSYNIALGSKSTIYFDAGFSLEYKSEYGLLIDIGASFTHYSNGALKIPNLGINLVAPKIGLGYNFNRPTEVFKYQVIPEFNKKSEFFISFFTGWENKKYYGTDVDSTSMYNGLYYPANGLSVIYNRQISYKSKLGIGLTVDYLGGANTHVTVKNGKPEAKNASLSDGLELSIFSSYELVINRISVIMQPGFYLYRSKYPFSAPDFYQRLGLKYNIYKDISFGINMHAHKFSIADYIEWSIGYTLHL